MIGDDRGQTHGVEVGGGDEAAGMKWCGVWMKGSEPGVVGLGSQCDGEGSFVLMNASGVEGCDVRAGNGDGAGACGERQGLGDGDGDPKRGEPAGARRDGDACELRRCCAGFGECGVDGNEDGFVAQAGIAVGPGDGNSRCVEIREGDAWHDRGVGGPGGWIAGFDGEDKGRSCGACRHRWNVGRR